MIISHGNVKIIFYFQVVLLLYEYSVIPSGSNNNFKYQKPYHEVKETSTKFTDEKILNSQAINFLPGLLDALKKEKTKSSSRSPTSGTPSLVTKSKSDSIFNTKYVLDETTDLISKITEQFNEPKNVPEMYQPQLEDKRKNIRNRNHKTMIDYLNKMIDRSAIAKTKTISIKQGLFEEPLTGYGTTFQHTLSTLSESIITKSNDNQPFVSGESENFISTIQSMNEGSKPPINSASTYLEKYFMTTNAIRTTKHCRCKTSLASIVNNLVISVKKIESDIKTLSTRVPNARLHSCCDKHKLNKIKTTTPINEQDVYSTAATTGQDNVNVFDNFLNNNIMNNQQSQHREFMTTSDDKNTKSAIDNNTIPITIPTEFIPSTTFPVPTTTDMVILDNIEETTSNEFHALAIINTEIKGKNKKDIEPYASFQTESQMENLPIDNNVRHNSTELENLSQVNLPNSDHINKSGNTITPPEKKLGLNKSKPRWCPRKNSSKKRNKNSNRQNSMNEGDSLRANISVRPTSIDSNNKNTWSMIDNNEYDNIHEDDFN